jgi:hypothetical protein
MGPRLATGQPAGSGCVSSRHILFHVAGGLWKKRGGTNPRRLFSPEDKCGLFHNYPGVSHVFGVEIAVVHPCPPYMRRERELLVLIQGSAVESRAAGRGFEGEVRDLHRH